LHRNVRYKLRLSSRMCVSPVTVLATLYTRQTDRNARNNTACTDRRTVTVTHCRSLHRQFVTNFHFKCNLISGDSSVVRSGRWISSLSTTLVLLCTFPPTPTSSLPRTPTLTPTYHSDVTFTRFQAVWPQNLMRNRCCSLVHSINAAASIANTQNAMKTNGTQTRSRPNVHQVFRRCQHYLRETTIATILVLKCDTSRAIQMWEIKGTAGYDAV